MGVAVVVVGRGGGLLGQRQDSRGPLRAAAEAEGCLKEVVSGKLGVGEWAVGPVSDSLHLALGWHTLRSAARR